MLQVPIMLRSDYCNLKRKEGGEDDAKMVDLSERELTSLGECPFDQGGYFVINGSEKVGARPPVCLPGGQQAVAGARLLQAHPPGPP